MSENGSTVASASYLVYYFSYLCTNLHIVSTVLYETLDWCGILSFKGQLTVSLYYGAYRGHTDEKNFVGLSVSNDSILCGEFQQTFARDVLWDISSEGQFVIHGREFVEHCCCFRLCCHGRLTCIFFLSFRK